MKKLIIYLLAYFIPGLACLLVATSLTLPGAIHDMLLLISGLLLGGVAVELTLINIEIMKRNEQ
jgi:hypothetical protein